MVEVRLSPHTVFLKLACLAVSVGIWVFLGVFAFTIGYQAIPQAVTHAGFFIFLGCFLTFVWLANVRRDSGGGEIPIK